MTCTRCQCERCRKHREWTVTSGPFAFYVVCAFIAFVLFAMKANNITARLDAAGIPEVQEAER